MTLTKAEREILKDLPAAVSKSWKSKRTLKLLGDMDHNGVITFDPFTEAASLTALGHELLKA